MKLTITREYSVKSGLLGKKLIAKIKVVPTFTAEETALLKDYEFLVKDRSAIINVLTDEHLAKKGDEKISLDTFVKSGWSFEAEALEILHNGIDGCTDPSRLDVDPNTVNVGKTIAWRMKQIFATLRSIKAGTLVEEVSVE